MLRRDELFVVETIAKECQAQWREGENPPDAYLTIASRRIALEVSTLVQLVPNAAGKFVPRQSQDEPALKIADDLNERLGATFHERRAMSLIFFSPLRNVRKLRASLEMKVTELAGAKEPPLEAIDFPAHGNNVVINVHSEWKPGYKRISGSVVNSRASADLHNNAVASLNDRIGSKASWSRVVAADESWLALLNIYSFLSSANTFKAAYRSVDVAHNFNRILIVSTAAEVDVLYPPS